VCWGEHGGRAVKPSVQGSRGKPTKIRLLPIAPSISKYLVSQAWDVPSTAQPQLQKTPQLTQPGAGCSSSASRTEPVPPTDYPGISQCMAQCWDSALIVFWVLYLHASEQLLLDRLLHVPRTDTFDVAKRDVANTCGKMTIIVMTQIVPWFRKGILNSFTLIRPH